MPHRGPVEPLTGRGLDWQTGLLLHCSAAGGFKTRPYPERGTVACD